MIGLKLNKLKFLASLLTLMLTSGSLGLASGLNCQEMLTKPAVQDQKIKSEQQVLEYISQNLDEKKVDLVIAKLSGLYADVTQGSQDKKMTKDQFFRLYSGLKQIATQYHIQIESKVDMLGVFPADIDLIQIAGFSEPAPTASKKNTHFAERHELGHLFHVIAIRAILVENSKELSGLTKNELSEFVKRIEGGRNYLEFEKIVTDLSGLLHVISPLKSKNERYGIKLNILLQGLKQALYSGKVKFVNGMGILEIYAKFISKVPIVLGQSVSDLAVRVPLLFFATSYFSNEDFRLWIHRFFL